MASDTLAPPRPELLPVEPLLVDLPTAAAMLSISERTLSSLVKARTVPHRRLSSRLLFSPVELREWIASGCQAEGA